MRNLLALLTLLVGYSVGESALAQATTGFLQQQRQIDDKLELERRQIGGAASILDWQWGGWIEYFYFNFDDGVQESRQVHRPGLVVWTRLGIDNGAHEFFGRMRLNYTYFERGDEFTRQQDWNGPRFDRAWYRIDVGRAFRLNQPSDPIQLYGQFGRQPVILGTGYALDLPLDAAVVSAKLWDFRLSGLFGRTPASTPNVDRSDAVNSHSDRHFYGAQLDYTKSDKCVPFAYALWNNDRTDERPQDSTQDYGYDTAYYGFGARGSIVHNLNYWAEAVFVDGSSYSDGWVRRRNNVNAFGADVGIEYLFDHEMRPRIAFEYMFASGDSGRDISPTNALGGNRGDFEDTSYIAFGFRDTGLALGPTPSNLHIWKFGGSMKPAPQVEALRDMELGTSWFLYHKHQANGAISDFTADRSNGFVGWEMDYFVNWRLASDLAWTLRWGTFFPAGAFSESEDERHFLFTGVTWSF